MKNILVYFPYNHRSVEQQSVMELLAKKGHHVFLLTLLPENDLHVYVRRFGIKASASPVEKKNKIISVFANARYLVKFCKQNNIDIILAHQQLCALPVIFALPFLKERTFYIRHNADEDYIKFPVKAWIMNRFINSMLRDIIAPSNVVYQYMLDHEKVNPAKMRRINYGYNFLQYEKADEQKAAQIKKEHHCPLLIISIARLVPVKRHSIMFEAIKTLADKGLDIKMICLGDGYLKDGLQSWIDANKLSDIIFLKGMKQNIFDYFFAADLLFHLSETEASNSVVKEAGFAGKAALVCERVGDFSDYIINGTNGFLVNKEQPLPQAIEVIEKLYNDKNLLLQCGENIHNTILKEFDINNVSLQYDELINNGSRNR